MRRQLLLALAIVAGLAWAVPLKAADVRGFDILGIKLGMTVDEVKTQAKAKGFDDVKRSLAPSFEQAVALENREQVQARDYNGTLRARFGGDSEKVEVFFTQTPGGSQAARISYRFFGPGVTIDQMTAQVIERYGAPDRQDGKVWLWGDTTELYFSRREPYLEFDRNPVPTFGANPPVGNLLLADPAFQARAREAIAHAASERAEGEKPRF